MLLACVLEVKLLESNCSFMHPELFQAEDLFPALQKKQHVNQDYSYYIAPSYIRAPFHRISLLVIVISPKVGRLVVANLEPVST